MADQKSFQESLSDLNELKCKENIDDLMEKKQTPGNPLDSCAPCDICKQYLVSEMNQDEVHIKNSCSLDKTFPGSGGDLSLCGACGGNTVAEVGGKNVNRIVTGTTFVSEIVPEEFVEEGESLNTSEHDVNIEQNAALNCAHQQFSTCDFLMMDSMSDSTGKDLSLKTVDCGNSYDTEERRQSEHLLMRLPFEQDRSYCNQDTHIGKDIGTFARRSCDEIGSDDEVAVCECSGQDRCLLHEGILRLDQLDDDVLFHIAGFLEARTVKYALSQVCCRFQALYDNESYWKMRIAATCPKKFPAVPCNSDFCWADACVEKEDSRRLWTDNASNMYHFMYGANIFGEVDAVHLMKKGELLVSGDRNRCMNLIDLTQYLKLGEGVREEDMLVYSDRNTHGGWIWSMTSYGNDLITGSWDTHVRVFDVAAGCVPTQEYSCKSVVLSLYAEENEIIASCFDRKVYFIDRRQAECQSRIFHTKPVLCVAGNENFIISGSEDKSISIYDRRANKIFMMFKLESYPLCMSYADNQLWFGDRDGLLHLHDGTDKVFQHIGTYDVGHTQKMTGLIHTRGSIFTCSGDRTVKVLEPTRDPTVVTSLDMHKKEIANIDYNNGVLVSAGGDDSIGVWMPRSRHPYLL